MVDYNSIKILEKQQYLYNDFLGQEKLWKHASNPDPFVRRSVYKLMVAALHKQKVLINMALISPYMLTSSLHINQAGSTYGYAKALALLTMTFPDAWTQHFVVSGKKTASKRLCQFLRKGSQGGPSDYWLQVSTMLRHIPVEVLLARSDKEVEKASDDSLKVNFSVLEAFQDGLTSRDEPRANQGEGWTFYLEISLHFQSILNRSEERYELLKSCILPLLSQYIRPSQEFSRWTVTESQPPLVCVQAFNQIVIGAQNLLEGEWNRLSTVVIDDIRASLPEQSKEYTKSQDSIIAETSRWYKFQAAILTKERSSKTIESMFRNTLLAELSPIINTIRTRNGKPYGAAAALETAIRLLPELSLGFDESRKIITEFVSNNVLELVVSPSGPYCIDILTHVESVFDVHEIRRTIIERLRDAPESPGKISALQRLISSASINQPGEAELLGAVVKHGLQQAMRDDKNGWVLVTAAMENREVPTELADDLLAYMAEGLSVDGKVLASLRGLDLVAKINGDAIKSFTLSRAGSDLLLSLLRLTESPDEDLSQQAKNFSTAIETIVSKGEGSNYASESLIKIIDDGIQRVETDSLSYVLVVLCLYLDMLN